MAGRGPAPKPSNLRQRTNKKSGAAVLEAPAPGTTEAPEIPNPDGRKWHPFTVRDWEHAWCSPMAGQWLETDFDALGRLAMLWDDFYKKPSADGLKEIRLQSALFGLSPLDRSRLSWEIAKAGDAEQQHARRVETAHKRTGTHDPRRLLSMVPKGKK